MQQRHKAVFLDKDGTLIPDIPYNVDPHLITLEQGVVEGLKTLQQAGFIFVLISNQSGVARGKFKYDALKGVSEKLTQLLAKDNLTISGFYYCPHHTDGIVNEYTIDCDCRKPKPGMLLNAADDLQIDLDNSWMIGDILNDCEAGNRAGCKTILINNGNETEWLTGPYRRPDFIAADFIEAANFIATNKAQTKEVDERKMATM